MPLYNGKTDILEGNFTFTHGSVFSQAHDKTQIRYNDALMACMPLQTIPVNKRYIVLNTYFETSQTKYDLKYQSQRGRFSIES